MNNFMTKLGLATLALSLAPSIAAQTMDNSDDTDQKGEAGAYNLPGPDEQKLKQQKESRARGEIYGFAMIDMGYNNGSINDKWFDVVRPTQLPNQDYSAGEFSANGYLGEGSTYASVRQSRLGVKGWFPTPGGKEVHTIFEFEMFGVGDDAGQTTIRLRHAYGEMGAFGGGQYWSPFMDINVFPNSVEYWGPTGMAFFRNVQFRWMPIRGDGGSGSDLTFALERPGFGRDGAVDEIETGLSETQVDVTYPVPDLSGAYSFGGDWGYVRLAGILRYVTWEGELLAGDPTSSVDESAVGYGLNFSTNLKFGPGNSVLKFAVVGGQGVQNYMNDATGDLGITGNANDSSSWKAETIPMIGTTLFYDLWWSDKLSSTIGFSTLDIDNRELDNPYNLRQGRYALLNLLYYPASNVMFGGELQYGYRKNYGDDSDLAVAGSDFDYDVWRVQFSARYNFSFGLGG